MDAAGAGAERRHLIEDGPAGQRFLAASNIIPDPGLPAEQLAVRCAICGAAMTLDHRGGLCTGPADCGFVCDPCGDAEAPAEMTLVRQLRSAVAFTVTVDGADPKVDPFATTCPVCDKDSQQKPAGWHVVDTVHGRPVCRACIQESVDASQDELAEQLNLLEQKYEVGQMMSDAGIQAHANTDGHADAHTDGHADGDAHAHTHPRPLTTACRRCHAHDLHRSHVRSWEHVLKLLTSRRPYRCGTCGWRGWLASG